MIHIFFYSLHDLKRMEFNRSVTYMDLCKHLKFKKKLEKNFFCLKTIDIQDQLFVCVLINHICR